MSVVLFTMLEMFPIGNIALPRQFWGQMQIEILASRGETVTSLEFPEPGRMRVILQMGAPKEHVKDLLQHGLKPEALTGLLKLWADSEHPRGFEEKGRSLLIFGSEAPEGIKFEILATRGATTPAIEFPEAGRIRLIVQTGTPAEKLQAACEPALTPAVLDHVIRLWADPEHARQFEEMGRNLLIRDCA